MMPNIKTKTRKGELTKVDGKWVVDYVAESAKMIEKTEIPIFPNHYGWAALSAKILI